MVHTCPYMQCFTICRQTRKGVKGFTVTHHCENKTVRYATKREATQAAKAIDRDRYGGIPKRNLKQERENEAFVRSYLDRGY